MAMILISFNGKKDNKHPLNKEITTIGRKNDNDILLDNLATSAHHAKITTILNDSFIEDLGSTNGTLLNGEKITKNILANGDIIKIGNHEIKYVNKEAIPYTDFEKTMIINTALHGLKETEGSEQIHQSVGKIIAEISTTDAGQKNPKKGIIHLNSGINEGHELVLTKILTTLGKPGVQVAAITRRPTGYFLVHIDGGDNGKKPNVNNKTIESTSFLLSHNDKVEIAGVQMTFLLI